MTTRPDYSGKRFLIADDESFMLGLLERALREFNVGAVVKATDGVAALRKLKDEIPN